MKHEFNVTAVVPWARVTKSAAGVAEERAGALSAI
jgi:hypothetical protein